MVKTVEKPKVRKPARTKRHGSPQHYLREWRKFRGFETQQALSEASGVRRPTITDLENGCVQYTQGVIEKLAAALTCTPADILSVTPYDDILILTIYRKLPAEQQNIVLRLVSALGKA